MPHIFQITSISEGVVIVVLIFCSAFFGVKCYHRQPKYEFQVTESGERFLTFVPVDVLQGRLYRRIGKIFMLVGGGILIARLLNIL